MKILGATAMLDGAYAHHDIAQILTPTASYVAVLHLAGLIAAGESMHHPEWHWDNNTRASLALLDAIHTAHVGKLVFSSTAAVYGEPTHLPLLETSPTNPVNTYGDTKLAIDKAITTYTRASTLGAISLRYFNVAGAHDCGDGTMIGERHNPETHLIPLALDTALDRRDKLTLYGDDASEPKFRRYRPRRTFSSPIQAPITIERWEQPTPARTTPAATAFPMGIT
ncbi:MULTISPECIES: NAD-dependent epimerase/dehydratase family protein [Nocardia]|uniref:NAD-dependent epimerase/dehydratase family protein n=1 Tax=Nocardia TaxID=1817 RepID=UPI002456AB77|nr:MULTISPECIES: NAD-dependent epimerase/dehydratase family protein [Nocardia]